MREPLGVIGTVAAPVLLFIVLGAACRARGDVGASSRPSICHRRSADPASPILIALSAVLSLVTIISIYREGASSSGCGDAAPPADDPDAHVLVKLLFTAVTLVR